MYLSSTTGTECMTTDEIRAWGKKRKYAREYVEYWVSHRVCEAGMDAASGPPHHINTRGAHGNLDEPWNLLALSPARHSGVSQRWSQGICSEISASRGQDTGSERKGR
jgi:hypothetical protein